MKKDITKAFAARIAQANRSELVVITYEIMSELITEAKNMEQSRQWQEFRKELTKCRHFLNEMMASLNYEYEVSIPLMAHYIYMDKQLVESIANQNTDNLTTTEEILVKLREAFIEVAKQDKSKPLMENTQEVYAGLTYGRNSLNESISGQENRGYKA